MFSKGLPNIQSLIIVICILFIISVITEIIIDDNIHPHSVFLYLFISTILSGITTAFIIEGINIHLFK